MVSKYKKHLSAVTFPRRRLLRGRGDDRDSESDDEGGYLPPVDSRTDFRRLNLKDEGEYIDLVKNLVLKLYDPSLTKTEIKSIRNEINRIKWHLMKTNRNLYNVIMEQLGDEKILRARERHKIESSKKYVDTDIKSIGKQLKTAKNQLKELKKLNKHQNEEEIRMAKNQLRELINQKKLGKLSNNSEIKSAKKVVKQLLDMKSSLRKNRKRTKLDNIVWDRIKRLPDNKIPDYNEIFDALPPIIIKQKQRRRRNISVEPEDEPMDEPDDPVDYRADELVEDSIYPQEFDPNQAEIDDLQEMMNRLKINKKGRGLNRRGNGEMLRKFNKSVRKLRKKHPDLTFREAQKHVSQMLRESE